MPKREYVVAAINLNRRLVVCEDDTIGQIEELYDGDGEVTFNVDEALACVVRMPEGWIALDLTTFEVHLPN